MLLAIDAGNTNTVFAVFKGEELAGQWRLSSDATRTADEYAAALLSLFALEGIEFSAVTHVITSTVVPQTIFPLKEFCRKYISCEPLFVGDAGVSLGMDVVIDKPEEVGADRLVNSVAAYSRFGGNVVIIDFGTATTFDVIDGKGRYVGGVIAPGINLSQAALHAAAAKLPEVAISNPGKVVGTSTVSAIQSGLYWGYVGMIEGIVQRINTERNTTMTVIATGGLARLFHKATDVIEHLDPDLTISGLKQIFEKNKNN